MSAEMSHFRIQHPHPGYYHPLVNSSGYMQWHYQESYFNEKMNRNAPPNTICMRQKPFQPTNFHQSGILEAEWNYYRNRDSQERCPKFDRLMPGRNRATPMPFNRGFSSPCSSMARTYSKIEISVKTGNVLKYSANDDQYGYAREKMQQHISNLEAKRIPEISIKSNTASNNPKRKNEIGTACSEPKVSYNNPTERVLQQNGEETVQATARQTNGQAEAAGEPLASQPQVGKTPKRALKRPQANNEIETVDKKSRADTPPDLRFIEKLNLHIGMTYLSDTRKALRQTSTAHLDEPIKCPSKQITASKGSNQVPFRKNKQRSKSVCLINGAPSFRTNILLKAKSLTHLPQFEGLNSLKFADCAKYIRSWPVPQLSHFDPPKSARGSLNQWKPTTVSSDLSRIQKSSDVRQVNDSRTDISTLRKKRRRICFIDSSDEEAEPTNRKQKREPKGFDSGRAGRKSEANKSKLLDPQKSKHVVTKPLIHGGQAKKAVSRKQMLLMLFGEDSENDEIASDKSSAAPKSSTQEKKPHRNRQESKHKEGANCSNKRHSGGAKSTRPHNKHDSLERAKGCTDQSDNTSNRKLILTDLFPDPSQELKKTSANKRKKRTKPPSHQDTKTQTPPRVKHRSKKDGEPSPTSNIRPKVREKIICKSEAAVEIDNKSTSSKFTCKSFPEPRFGIHKELWVELQSCSRLSSPNWPTHQKAKVNSEKEHCTETCYLNDAVDKKIASKVLKTEVVVKEEESSDNSLMVFTCVNIQNDSKEGQVVKLKDEPVDTFETEYGKSKETVSRSHFSDPSQNLEEYTEEEYSYYKGLSPNSKQSSKGNKILSSNMLLRVDHQVVNQTIIESIQEFTSIPGRSLSLAAYQCSVPKLANAQQFFMEFESSLPLSSAAPVAMQQAKSSTEENHCQETCHVNDAADVKNDSQVVKSVAEVDHGLITLYRCTDAQNDDDDEEVQIVSVTVPTTLQDNSTMIPTLPKEEQSETPLNANRFLVDLHSMGSALISCGAVSKEPKARSSKSALPVQSSVVENAKHNLITVSRDETGIGSVLQVSEGRYLPPRTQPNVVFTAPRLVQLVQPNSNRSIMTSKSIHNEPESVYVPSSLMVASQSNVPQCTASTVAQINRTPEEHSVLSVRDRTLIEQILFSHIYFLMHLCCAQRAYLDCLQGRLFYKHYFNYELQWFEKDKNRRISSQSRQMRLELLQLHIKASKNLSASAEGILDNVIKMLLKADMNNHVSKSGVYLCLWMLMSGHADMYASVPLFKVMMRHASLVFNKLNSRCSPTFSPEMRETLLWQIQQYNKLVEWSSRTDREVRIASNQSAPTLTLYLQNRYGNEGSVPNSVNAAGFSVNQQPIGSTMSASLSSSFHTPNTMFPKRLEAPRGQVSDACGYKTPGYNPLASLRHIKPRTAAQPVNLLPEPHLHKAASPSSRSLTELSAFEKPASPFNDNFRIKLPYSRPITAVTTCSTPLTSMASSGLGTTLATVLATEPNKQLNQGIGALSLIGQSSLMLTCNNSEQELTKRLCADTSGSLPGCRPSVDSLQQDQAAAGSQALTSNAETPEVEWKNKPVQSPCPAVDSARCSSAASSEEVETIDLTWLDDIDEAELNEEMDFVCVKPEMSDEGSGMAQEGDEDVMYTIVYDTNMCICEETPKYRCNCGQAWYCGKACQLKDWDSHRKICQVVSGTKKTDLPLPET